MITAVRLSKYICFRFARIYDDTIYYQAMQKLLFFCQADYLYLHDKPLFSDKIYKTSKCTIIRSVYQLYKEYSDATKFKLKALNEKDEYFNCDSLKQRDTIDKILNKRAIYTNCKLRESIEASPAFKKTKLNKVISHQAMIDSQPYLHFEFYD